MIGHRPTQTNTDSKTLYNINVRVRLCASVAILTGPSSRLRLPSGARPLWPLRAGGRIPHSTFRIPTSHFRIPTSPFRIPTSPFRLPHSFLLPLPPSTFQLPHSHFPIPPSHFKISPVPAIPRKDPGKHRSSHPRWHMPDSNPPTTASRSYRRAFPAPDLLKFGILPGCRGSGAVL